MAQDTVKDRCLVASTTTGTGTYTLGSAVTGYQTFANVGNGNTTFYCAYEVDASGNPSGGWEVGKGTYTSAGTTLARTTILASSNADAAVNWSAGTRRVAVVEPAARSLVSVVDTSGNVLATKFAALSDLTAVDPALADVLAGYDASGAANAKFQADRLLGLGRRHPGGRLTLTSGTPVTTSDVTGATSVYYTPYLDDVCEVWDGTRWVTGTFAETTLALGTLLVGQAYDVFAYLSSGTFTLESAEWKNATVTVTVAAPGVVTWTAHGLITGNTFIFTTSGALPTGLGEKIVYYVTKVDANTFKLSTTAANMDAGTFITTTGSQSGTHTGHMPHARQTAVTYQDGRLCKSGDKTRLYLGTFVTTIATTTEDSERRRFLWNMYNRDRRPVRRIDTTDSWTYSTATYRQMNGSATNQIELVQGVAESELDLTARGQMSSTVAGAGYVAVGEDSELTPEANSLPAAIYAAASSADARVSDARIVKTPTIGYHFYPAMERGIGSGTQTWYGDGGAPTLVQNGLVGTWEC